MNGGAESGGSSLGHSDSRAAAAFPDTISSRTELHRGWSVVFDNRNSSGRRRAERGIRRSAQVYREGFVPFKDGVVRNRHGDVFAGLAGSKGQVSGRVAVIAGSRGCPIGRGVMNGRVEGGGSCLRHGNGRRDTCFVDGVSGRAELHRGRRVVLGNCYRGRRWRTEG